MNGATGQRPTATIASSPLRPRTSTESARSVTPSITLGENPRAESLRAKVTSASSASTAAGSCDSASAVIQNGSGPYAPAQTTGGGGARHVSARGCTQSDSGSPSAGAQRKSASFEVKLSDEAAENTRTRASFA